MAGEGDDGFDSFDDNELLEALECYHKEQEASSVEAGSSENIQSAQPVTLSKTDSVIESSVEDKPSESGLSSNSNISRPSKSSSDSEKIKSAHHSESGPSAEQKPSGSGLSFNSSISRPSKPPSSNSAGHNKHTTTSELDSSAISLFLQDEQNELSSGSSNIHQQQQPEESSKMEGSQNKSTEADNTEGQHLFMEFVIFQIYCKSGNFRAFHAPTWLRENKSARICSFCA